MVFLRLPFERGTKCLSLEKDSMIVDEIQNYVASICGINEFQLYYNDKLLDKQHFIPRDATIQVAFSLPGGKGGFGSMLRAIGAQIEKTTNREACRDLSGRRLRDINEEQRLKKWIAKESEREAEKARRRQARIERLKLKPKHNFVDFEYEKEISLLPERVDEALHAGMEKVGKRPKAAETCSAPPSKKKKLWMDEDISDSSDSDSQKESKPSGSSYNNEKPHSSRSEASGSESSNDSHSVAEHNTVEKEVQMVENFDEDTSSDANSKNQPISSSDDATQDGTTLNVAVIREPTSHKSEAPQKITLDALKETTSVAEQSNMLSEASCSFTVNDKERETNLSGKVKNDPQLVEDQIDDVDLLSFESVSELESLGLERLKVALATRGLKCGGSISDRAQRLWKVKGLEPHEYPANLLAKNKK